MIIIYERILDYDDFIIAMLFEYIYKDIYIYIYIYIYINI